MGRLPILQETNGESPSPHPPESTEDGCPGSWYRSVFALSVSRYERLLTDSGFSDNLHLSRSQDRLLLDAVAYLEMQRLRARNRDEEARAAEVKRGAK
ncbi:MAG: hypothetical protein AAFP15_12200 [Bacteroidota bacterium]